MSYFNALRQPYLKTLYLVWVWPRGMPLSFLIFSRLRQLLPLFSQLQVGLDPRPRQNARLSENPKEVLFWTIGTTVLVLVGCVCVCLGAVCFFFFYLYIFFSFLSPLSCLFVHSFNKGALGPFCVLGSVTEVAGMNLIGMLQEGGLVLLVQSPVHPTAF